MFTIKRWVDFNYFISDGVSNYLWKDLTIQKSTGFNTFGKGFDKAPGYYGSRQEAQETLDAYLRKENKMSSNYMVIDGKRIDISDETAKNLKDRFGKKKEIPFVRTGRFLSGYKPDRLILRVPPDLKNTIAKYNVIAIDVADGLVSNFWNLRNDDAYISFYKSVKPLGG